MMVRKFGVWIGLLLTLVACYWVTVQKDEGIELFDVNQQKSRAYKSVKTKLPEHGVEKEITFRTADLSPPHDLFAALAVSNADMNLAENKFPTVPANPYAYAGKISQDNIWTVFLTDGMNNFSVKTGEALQGGWHVKRIQTEEITLVYQPLKQEVKLNIGATF